MLGDASLELGDLADARRRPTRALRVVADGSAARVRAARLAFVQGDPAAAVAGDRAAVAAAIDEGLEGDALGFYHVTLGETLIATGDAAGARAAFEAALAVRPGPARRRSSGWPSWTRRRRLSAAIAELDTAIAAIPLPDSLARRADLLDAPRRGRATPARPQADAATVEAIAQLAGEAGSVYDRGLSLYLSDHGLDPERAVTPRPRRARRAARRLRLRHPRLGAAQRGRRRRRRTPRCSPRSRPARKDARLWYHAGLIALANGRPDEAATYLARRPRPRAGPGSGRARSGRAAALATIR